MLEYKVESSLVSFPFWGQARDHAEYFTDHEMDTIEQYFADFDDLTETTINDYFAYDVEFLCNLVGSYKTDVFGTSALNESLKSVIAAVLDRCDDWEEFLAEDCEDLAIELCDELYIDAEYDALKDDVIEKSQEYFEDLFSYLDGEIDRDPDLIYGDIAINAYIEENPIADNFD